MGYQEPHTPGLGRMAAEIVAYDLAMTSMMSGGTMYGSMGVDMVLGGAARKITGKNLSFLKPSTLFGGAEDVRRMQAFTNRTKLTQGFHQHGTVTRGLRSARVSMGDRVMASWGSVARPEQVAKRRAVHAVMGAQLRKHGVRTVFNKTAAQFGKGAARGMLARYGVASAFGGAAALAGPVGVAAIGIGAYKIGVAMSQRESMNFSEGLYESYGSTAMRQRAMHHMSRNRSDLSYILGREAQLHHV